jgi:hypothetical protein
MKLTTVSLAIAAAMAAQVGPAFAQATNPGLRLQYSEITGIEDKVYIFGVPTTDSAGRRRSFDVVIDLTAMSDGTPATSALVTSRLSPTPPLSPKIVPGAYKSNREGTCTITNFALRSGRTQSQMRCLADAGSAFEITLVTGGISAGHPFETQLKAAGINTRPDVTSYIWGLVTLGVVGNFGGCGTMYGGSIIGGQQAGNNLTLSLFNTAGEFKCSTTLIKTTP